MVTNGELGKTSGEVLRIPREEVSVDAIKRALNL
jgi:hypothetical protein